VWGLVTEIHCVVLRDKATRARARAREEDERDRARGESTGGGREGGPRLMNQEPSSWVSAPNVRKEDPEKQRRPRPLQTKPHFILQR
jgi:hypothetical protein